MCRESVNFLLSLVYINDVAWVNILDFPISNETTYSFPHEGKMKKKRGEKKRERERKEGNSTGTIHRISLKQ